VNSRFVAYFVAVTASLFVVLIGYVLVPSYGADTAQLIVFMAPVIASLYGTKPGLLATALCLSGSAYFLIEPLYTLQVGDTEIILRLVVFGLLGIKISLIGGYWRKSKLALQASVQRQQIALNAAKLGLFEWDMQADITIWENDQMYEIFGHTRADGPVNLKQLLEHYIYKEDVAEFEKFLNSALRSGGRVNSSCRIIRKSDQEVRLIEFSSRFQYSPDNTPTKIVGVAKDITEQRIMESTIERTRNHLQSILDTVPACIHQVDINGNYEFVNRAYGDLVGHEVSSLIGRNVTDVFEAGDAGVFNEHSNFVFNSHETKEFEEKVTMKDGVHIYDSIKTPIFGNDGIPSSVLCVCTDMTERIRLVNELRDSDARKDEFLAILGHELRNPLAPLCAGIELLSQVKNNPKMIEDIQAMMHRQASHLLRLVDDLLNMSRISRGLIELHRNSLDVNSIIPQALEQVETIYNKRLIKVITKCSDEGLLVDGDLDRLTQVVVNLLTNAAKFMDGNGTVTISTYAEDGQAVLKVGDTGYGIPAEHLESIFQMFSQVPEHKVSTGGGGLGIGLALSHKLIEMHGGSICVSSEGSGLGSEFTVKIPLIRS